jgi:hypothetical protein
MTIQGLKQQLELVEKKHFDPATTNSHLQAIRENSTLRNLFDEILLKDKEWISNHQQLMIYSIHFFYYNPSIEIERLTNYNANSIWNRVFPKSISNETILKAIADGAYLDVVKQFNQADLTKLDFIALDQQIKLVTSKDILILALKHCTIMLKSRLVEECPSLFRNIDLKYLVDFCDHDVSLIKKITTKQAFKENLRQMDLKGLLHITRAYDLKTLQVLIPLLPDLKEQLVKVDKDNKTLLHHACAHKLYAEELVDILLNACGEDVEMKRSLLGIKGDNSVIDSLFFNLSHYATTSIIKKILIHSLEVGWSIEFAFLIKDLKNYIIGHFPEVISPFLTTISQKLRYLEMIKKYFKDQVRDHSKRDISINLEALKKSLTQNEDEMIAKSFENLFKEIFYAYQKSKE